MVTIITGEINSGKTTLLKRLYSENRSGDGFLSTKAYKNGIHIGYDLLSISKNSSEPFIRKKQYLDSSDKTIFNIGSYYFLEKTFNRAVDSLNHLLQNKTEPIYIDELGPLELQKKCFYKSVINITKNSLPLITCVRRSCLQEIITLFNFDHYRIVEA